MDAPSLTSVLDGWWVTLRSGGTVDIAAHAAKETDSLLVFVVLAKGQPNFELAVAAFPMDEVQDWGGGHKYDGTFPRVGPLPLL
jgi:hypothetical protein